MADHAKPILTDNYTDVLSQIRGRFEDQAKGFDPANTTATNISTGTIRWNSAEKKFQKWSGTAWGDLTDNYVLSGATFSTGTANGVAYLNGSKVLTTGSALTFDGATLRVSGSIGTGGAIFTNNEGGIFLNGFASYGSGLFSDATGQQIRFQAAGSEQMRLTSTGLSIGTSSPAYKLDVRGTGSQTVAVRTQISGDPIVYLEAGGANAGFVQYSRSAQALQLSGQNPTVHATLDSSGNLGLGVTPSAWGNGSSARAFELTATYFWSFGNAVGEVGTNAYYNSSSQPIYKTSQFATAYRQRADNGQHQWFTAPSGTAGNPISFTQAMTLDANGKLILSAANQGIQFADGTTQTTASFAGSYEPTIGATTSNFTGTREGLFYYTKVGNIVTVTGRFSVTKQVAGIASGDITITVPVSGRNTFAPVRGVLTTEASTYVSASPAYYGIPMKLIIGTSTGSTVNVRVDGVAGYQFSSWFVDVSFSYPLI